MTGDLGEFELIGRFFKPLADAPEALGLADDAAVLASTPDTDLVLTKDALIAGVHFLADDTPERIAKKALRVNLSDLIAKGATPIGYLLVIALPDDWSEDWLTGFTSGLREDHARYRIALWGGDTVRTPGPLMVSVTCIGTVPTGGMVKRGAAKPGDAIYVSGTIGDGALGLKAALGTQPQGLEAADVACLDTRYRVPSPPLPLAPVLRAHARAGMDISDGLIADLDKMCRVSGTGAVIEAAKVPLSDAARSAVTLDGSLLQTCLTGGDDYEVLASIDPASAPAFETAARTAGVRVTRIGHMTLAGEGVVCRDAAGDTMIFDRRGYEHR